MFILSLLVSSLLSSLLSLSLLLCKYNYYIILFLVYVLISYYMYIKIIIIVYHIIVITWRPRGDSPARGRRKIPRTRLEPGTFKSAQVRAYDDRTWC